MHIYTYIHMYSKISKYLFMYVYPVDFLYVQPDLLIVRKLTKTTKREKENHRLTSALLKGYVTSLAGNIPPIIMASQPTPRNVTPPEIKGKQWLALNKASFLEGDKLGGGRLTSQNIISCSDIPRDFSNPPTVNPYVWMVETSVQWLPEWSKG